MTVNTNYSKLMNDLGQFGSSNLTADQYYEGQQHVRQLGLALPPNWASLLETVVGWPATCVDVLHERIDWMGWDTDAKYKQVLTDAHTENQLRFESELGHLDSLLYGMAYACVSKGDKKAGEPEWLVNVESAKTMYGVYNRRTRRLEVAASKGFEDGAWLTGILYERDKTTYYRRATETSRWKVEHVEQHNLGRVPVVRFPNRQRAGNTKGRSEITKAVRSYTNNAVRTLGGMEINREFFSSPQRYALGAPADAFTDEAGNPIPGWKAILGSLWNIERDEDWAEQHQGSDGLPQVGQFPSSTPGPYIDQLEGLAKMFAAEVGIPPNYLGFTTENPPSGDAIRALEARLIKRAERRITGWDPAWREVAQLIVYMATKDIPKIGDMYTIWRSPGTPTEAADADRAVKLTGSGILPVESDLVLEMNNFTPTQIERIKRDRTRAELKAMVMGDGGAGTDGGPAGQNAQPNQPTGNPANSAPVAKPAAAS